MLLEQPVIWMVAVLVPLALISANIQAGNQRRAKLQSMLEAASRLSATFFGEYAAYRYGLLEPPSSGWPRVLWIRFSEAVALLLYAVLTGACIASIIMLSKRPELLNQVNILFIGVVPAPQTSDFQASIAKFYTIAFAAAYLWSIYALISRAAMNALRPLDYLEAALQILVALLLSYILAPLILLATPGVATAVLATAAAVVIGVHRPLEVLALRRWRATWDKKSVAAGNDNPSASLADEKNLGDKVEYSPPLEQLYGIDRKTKSWLQSGEISEVDALAMANPVLLAVETPISLAQAVELVAQAQLCTIVGASGFRALKRLAVQTLFDLEALAKTGERTADDAAEIVLKWPMPPAPYPPALAGSPLLDFCARSQASLHAQRLLEVRQSFSAPIGRSISSGESTSDLYGIEQRVLATIKGALAPPSLTRYSGWVVAQLIDASARSDETIVSFRFLQARPKFGTIAQIRILEGLDAEWVEFSVELRVGFQEAGAARLQAEVPKSANSKEYILSVPLVLRENPDVRLQIFQKNQLIQVMDLADRARDDA